MEGHAEPPPQEGDHLLLGNWKPICCAVTEARLVWMVVFRRIQQRLYEVGVFRDNMWGSTQEVSFLYDM